MTSRRHMLAVASAMVLGSIWDPARAGLPGASAGGAGFDRTPRPGPPGMARVASGSPTACSLGAQPDNDPVPRGWTLIGVPGAKPARFTEQADGAIRITADAAAGFLVRPLPGGGNARSVLTWHWLVSAAPPPSPPQLLGQDDRPAAVHVVFADAPTDGGLGAMLRRWVRGAVLHDAFAGRVLTYMWGGTWPAGSRLSNPYLPGDGAIIVLRGPEARPGHWQMERVVPAEDYRIAFGDPAPEVTHLALSADTEDRGGCSSALIRPPQFSST